MTAIATGNKLPLAKAPEPPARKDILPPEARARLIALTVESDSARDAAQSAQRRIEDLRRGLAYSDTPPANAGSIEHEISRLQAARSVAHNRHGVLAALLSIVPTWRQRLGSGVILEMGPDLDAKPEDGKTVAQAIETVRIQISNTVAYIGRAQRAPLPVAMLKEHGRAYVADLAAHRKLTVDPKPDGIAVRFNDPRALGVPNAGMVLPMLAALAPDILIARINEAIDALGIEPSLTMTPASRQRHLDLGRSNLLQLERTEEGLIRRAETEGLMVLRRPDADVRAVLNVQPARKAVERVKPKTKTAA
jgi:hypothetical protein